MKSKWLLIALSLACLGRLSVIYGQTPAQDLEPIVVQLSTENCLAPLYLAPIVNEQARFSTSYLNRLEQILSFDLNHNASSHVVERSSASDRTLADSYESFGPLADWKAKNILFVVKARVEGDSLSALLLDVDNQTLRSAEPILLSGELNQDRRQVHQLADTIHKALFGKDGIACTRLLYTVKQPVSSQNKWVSEVWESDYDGENKRRITKGSAYCVTPAYIPPKPGYATGGMIYVSYEIGQPKIYIAALKDGIGHRLTSLRGNQLMPVVSRQRDKVALLATRQEIPIFFYSHSVLKQERSASLSKFFQLSKRRRALRLLVRMEHN